MDLIEPCKPCLESLGNDPYAKSIDPYGLIQSPPGYEPNPNKYGADAYSVPPPPHKPKPNSDDANGLTPPPPVMNKKRIARASIVMFQQFFSLMRRQIRIKSRVKSMVICSDRRDIQLHGEKYQQMCVCVSTQNK